MVRSSLITAIFLPILVSASSLRTAGTCGGDYGGCGAGTYCRTGACGEDLSKCLGICLPYPNDGSYDPKNDLAYYQNQAGQQAQQQQQQQQQYQPQQQQQYQPQSGGFQFSGQQGYQPQGFQPAQQSQQQQQASSGLSCVNGYNAQCPQGTVCLADPRNPAITPVAICVPATKPCGGPSNTVCSSGLFCMADPRVNCNPNRGDKGCSGLCV